MDETLIFTFRVASIQVRPILFKAPRITLNDLKSYFFQGNCMFIIDSTGSAETASWNLLWQAMVAINGMCTRFGRTGTAYALGISRLMN